MKKVKVIQSLSDKELDYYREIHHELMLCVIEYYNHHCEFVVARSDMNARKSRKLLRNIKIAQLKVSKYVEELVIPQYIYPKKEIK
jgi:hypothetical protein